MIAVVDPLLVDPLLVDPLLVHALERAPPAACVSLGVGRTLPRSQPAIVTTPPPRSSSPSQPVVKIVVKS